MLHLRYKNFLTVIATILMKYVHNILNDSCDKKYLSLIDVKGHSFLSVLALDRFQSGYPESVWGSSHHHGASLEWIYGGKTIHYAYCNGSVIHPGYGKSWTPYTPKIFLKATRKIKRDYFFGQCMIL